jgi:integrase/ribosomal protein L37AE/L43A
VPWLVNPVEDRDVLEESPNERRVDQTGMAELTSNATSPADCTFGKVGPSSGKSESAAGSADVSPICPQCNSKKVWRDGSRFLFDQKIQRWICRDCGLRFSDPKDPQKAKATIIEMISTVDTQSLKTFEDIVGSGQICVMETKNLAAEPQTTEVLRRNQTDVKGKIVEYIWWLKKGGYSEQTILGRSKLLLVMTKRGADLYDPETIKEVIAKQTWSNGRKNNAVDAYSSFLKMVGGEWDAPLYHCIRKLPFIPKETEIDQLIAGCTQRVATFLQMLKETGARCGEIWQLKWDDVDFESKVVNITAEKNSNPRVVHLSNKMLEMLTQIPKIYGERIFSLAPMPVDHFGTLFCIQRKRLAIKLSNPRLMKIHFHTFRYWKGTMLYHQTKDIYYVMQRLGHKNIKNTLLYIQLEEALFQGETDYISKVAKTEKDVCSLVEAGFEYVTDFQDAKIFRKRKL